MLPFASPLTSAAAARWSAALVPPWVAKGALTAGWAAALVAAAVGETMRCTPQAPSLCGPDQGFAWWVVICLATPVLLVWLPLLGCIAGVVFALADLAFDDVTSANVGFGLHGLACAAVALWLLRSAAAQQVIAADAGQGRVPRCRPRRGDRTPTGTSDASGPQPGWSCWGRACSAGTPTSSTRNGVTSPPPSRSPDGSSPWTTRTCPITVDAPTSAGLRRVTVGVLDTAPYPRGSATPVLLDPGDPTWARLVAEPQDDTGWESAGLGALLLAVLVMGRGLQVRRARERLWTGEHPALRVWVVPDEVGDAVVFADDGTRPDVLTASPIARLAFGVGPRRGG